MTTMATLKITFSIPPTFPHCNNSTVKINHRYVPIWHTPATINLLSAKQSLDGRGLLYTRISSMLVSPFLPFALKRTLNPCNSHKSSGSFVRPLLAVGSGVEASVSDENVVPVKNANIFVESQDDDMMQVKVELSGKDTQIVFEKVLANLARTAPPVPGFRRQKGGKTSKVPKSFLLSIIGEDRVTKFVIQEIVSSTMAEYVKKENISVKDNKINTLESAEELESSFKPGSDFGFSATLELQKQDVEISGSNSSEA